MRDPVKNLPHSSWLSGTLMLGSLAMVVGILYVARALFIPIALSILLTFILAPIVTTLRRKGLGRTWSVILTVMLTFLFLGGIGAILFQQLKSLADDLPAYRLNISQKISDLKLASRGGTIEKVQETVKQVMQDVDQALSSAVTNAPAIPVVVTNPKPAESQVDLFGPLLEPLATAGLVVVLVIFMSLRREDLRDRLLRLAGYGRLATTTKAIDEAGKRVSKYLLRQSLINAGFGLCVGLGLFAIGLPYAILWGVLAGIARFIPYAGPVLGAAAPILASLAVFENWRDPLMVIGLMLLLELIQNLVVEPLVYGQGIGVSEVALLVIVAFWTWLWGPIGLVLAAPLTVCLMVIGKSVPDLEFIGLLLSREPALAPHHAFYQRLIARDEDEAHEIVETYLKDHPRIELFESLLMPALASCRQDGQQQRLTPEDQAFVWQMIRQCLDEGSDAGRPAQTSQPRARMLSEQPRPGLLGFPAQGTGDELALLMLAELLREEGWEMRVLSPEILSAEALAEVDAAHPAAVCLGSLSGGSLFAARQFCKRLRSQHPALPLVVGRWLGDDGDKVRSRFSEFSVEVGTRLAETKNQLIQMSQTQPAAKPAAPNGAAPILTILPAPAPSIVAPTLS